MRPVASRVRSPVGNGPSPEELSPDERIRGPFLDWPSRTWKVGDVRRRASNSVPRGVSAPSPACRVEERFGGASANRVVFGDSLDVARALLDEGWGRKVDLVYVDPPFASQSDYTQETRLDGPADGRIVRSRAYDDCWPTKKGSKRGGAGDEDGVSAYLDMLAPRLEAMAELLAPTGSLWVHLDWRAAYLVRVLLDEIMGRESFVNEVVWRRAPNLGRQAASGQFGRTLDTLVVYGGPEARLHPPTRLEPSASAAIRRVEAGRAFSSAPRGDYTDASMARLQAEGRVHRTATGRQYVKYFLEPNDKGELCRERRIDTLWTDVAPLRHASVAERTGFPTQKPRALLERIIRCATPEGGTVVDLFAGSGTTGDAAHALGRTFVLGDRGPVALNATRARLLRAGAAFAVESCGGVVAPAGPVPEVTVHQGAAGVARVELREPTEPLAWAIGPKPRQGEPFAATWHSARQPGVVPVAAAREGLLPDAPLLTRARPARWPSLGDRGARLLRRRRRRGALPHWSRGPQRDPSRPCPRARCVRVGRRARRRASPRDPGASAASPRSPARRHVGGVPGRRAHALRARARLGVRDEAPPRAPAGDSPRASVLAASDEQRRARRAGRRAAA